MRNRFIAAVVAGLAAAVILGWIIVRFGMGDDSGPAVTAGSVNKQSSRNEAAAPRAERGNKTRQRDGDASGAHWISVEELKARLDRGEKVLVVNTRSSDSEPLIQGAIVVPEDDIESWSEKIPKSTAIVTYCSCQDDSAGARAALKLRWRGFTDVHVLRGGLTGWQKSGYPTQPAN